MRLHLWHPGCPLPSQMWRCFEHVTSLVGRGYFRWANADKAMLREDASGDYTTVNVGEFRPVMQSAVDYVRQRRLELDVADDDAAADGGGQDDD